MTFPKITCPTSDGSVRERFSASTPAATPRSIAETSEQTPLYSAMGVRAPSRITISWLGIISALPLSVVQVYGSLVESPPHRIEVDRLHFGVHPVGEKDVDSFARRIEPHGRPGKTRVAEGSVSEGLD